MSDATQVEPVTEKSPETEQQAEHQASGLDAMSAEELRAAVRELRAEAAAKRVRNKELTAQVEKAKQAEEARRQAELEEQGKFQQLAEEASAKSQGLQQKLDAMSGTLQAVLDARLDEIPDSLKALIPETFSTQEKLDYISTPAFQELSRQGKPLPQGQTTPGDPDRSQAQVELNDLEERAKLGDEQAQIKALGLRRRLNARQ